jgi:uncharacterized protein
MSDSSHVLDETEGRQALAMARTAIAAWLELQRHLGAAELRVPSEGAWHSPHGIFVTLRKPDGDLRGCIGRIEPGGEPLWEVLRDSAVSAAVRDPRFPPVTAAELPELSLKVSVLTAPRSIPGPESFEVGRHGIIMELRGRSAVFLPEVATDFGWDCAATLSQLCRKAGLELEDWRDPGARFQVFETQLISEPA